MAYLQLLDPGPEYEYVLVPKKKDQVTLLTEERDKLQEQLDSIHKPTDEELIAEAKWNNLYYIIEFQLNAINDEIKKLNEEDIIKEI